jgi:hypothetical protein
MQKAGRKDIIGHKCLSLNKQQEGQFLFKVLTLSTSQDRYKNKA